MGEASFRFRLRKKARLLPSLAKVSLKSLLKIFAHPGPHGAVLTVRAQDGQTEAAQPRVLLPLDIMYFTTFPGHRQPAGLTNF